MMKSMAKRSLIFSFDIYSEGNFLIHSRIIRFFCLECLTVVLVVSVLGIRYKMENRSKKCRGRPLPNSNLQELGIFHREVDAVGSSLSGLIIWSHSLRYSTRPNASGMLSPSETNFSRTAIWISLEQLSSYSVFVMPPPECGYKTRNHLFQECTGFFHFLPVKALYFILNTSLHGRCE